MIKNFIDANQLTNVKAFFRFYPDYPIDRNLPGTNLSAFSYLCCMWPEYGNEESERTYIDMLIAIAEKGPNLFKPNSHGESCLHLAARRGNHLATQLIQEALKQLYPDEWKVLGNSVRTAYGATALDLAKESGCLTTQYLLMEPLY